MSPAATPRNPMMTPASSFSATFEVAAADGAVDVSLEEPVARILLPPAVLVAVPAAPTGRVEELPPELVFSAGEDVARERFDVAAAVAELAGVPVPV